MVATGGGLGKDGAVEAEVSENPVLCPLENSKNVFFYFIDILSKKKRKIVWITKVRKKFNYSKSFTAEMLSVFYLHTYILA